MDSAAINPIWSRRSRLLALFAILLIAALLRIQQIEQPYVDEFAWREADTASIADSFAGGQWNIFLPQVRWGGPGPNYIGAEFQTVSYLAALAYQIFGPAAWVGRTICAAFGLWGIFALYQLVRRVWGTSAGMAAAGAMAVMPGSVFIERSFLPDAAMTALMTTSLWMLVAWGQTRQQRYLLAAVLTGAWGCLTKLTGGILLVPALYAVRALLGERLHDRRTLIQLIVAATLVALPVVAYYAWARHLASSNVPFHFTGGGKFIWSGEITEWLRNSYYLPQFWHAVATGLWGLPLILLAALGLVAGPMFRSPPRAPWLMHMWLFAMLLRYLIEARHLVTDPYNIHLFNPMVAAFAGLGLVRIASFADRLQANQPRMVYQTLVFSAAALTGAFSGVRWYASETTLNPYRDHYVLAQHVAQLSRPNDLVISMGLEPVVLYYSGRKGWVFPPEEIANMRPDSSAYVPDYGPRDIAMLAKLRQQGARWLVIPSFNSYLPAARPYTLHATYPEFYAGLMADFEVIRDLPEGLLLRAR